MFARWLVVLGTVLLVACSAHAQIEQGAEATPTTGQDTQVEPGPTLLRPEDTLPADGVVAGWTRTEDVRTYDSDTLFDFMDGAADLYFTYGFEQLAVGQYANAEGAVVQVEVYRTATDEDAYGLFAYNSYGEPAAIGIDGELSSGSRLAFWQGRAFVQIVARSTVKDEALRAFGEAVAAALPAGGERPALVRSLPTEGLARGSVRFFRQRMALDNFLWLGSEDVLGLGEDATGVVAHYELDGREGDLLLVEFPDAPRAQAALAGLQGAGVEELVATQVNGSTLGAVLGQLTRDQAVELLERALAAVH